MSDSDDNFQGKYHSVQNDKYEMETYSSGLKISDPVKRQKLAELMSKIIKQSESNTTADADMQDTAQQDTKMLNKSGDMNTDSTQGMIYEDNIDHKQYMIKSSGTIIDLNRKKKKTRKIPMSVKKPVSQYVYFIKSVFENRQPTLFFPYPSYVGEKKEEFDRVFFKHQRDIGSLTMRFKILDTTNIYNAVVNSCKNAGMFLINERQMLKKRRKAQGYETSSSDEEDKDENEDDFNLLFCGAVKDDLLKAARSYQKLNHFPNSFNIGRKDAMWRNYLALHEDFPDEYNF